MKSRLSLREPGKHCQVVGVYGVGRVDLGILLQSFQAHTSIYTPEWRTRVRLSGVRSGESVRAKLFLSFSYLARVFVAFNRRSRAVQSMDGRVR